MKFNNKYLKSILLSCIVVSLLTSFSMHTKYFDLLKAFVHQKKMKYILQWTSSMTMPFIFMKEGREAFFIRNCPYTNCYVTSNKTLLSDYTKFDVIVFSGPDLATYYYEMPEKRFPHQKYVFASIESPHNYHLCSEEYNNYFNWSWTYRLDSDVRWGYVVIRDVNNKIIGPNKIMHWMNVTEMKPIDEELKKELKQKKKIAAWIVSNCSTRSKREILVNELQYELLRLDKHYMIDVFGQCGAFDCPYDKCYEKIKKSYYFYLALENSLSEEYVTEKLLIALENNAVPVVYGAANYTMYMPDGIYLDGMKLDTRKLAQRMHELVLNPEKYQEYFKWQNHYSYHKTEESLETNEYCQFCKVLNDEGLVKKKSVIENFITWWNLPGICIAQNL